MSAVDPFALQKSVKRRIIDESITQRTLCQKLGVGVSSLSRWLNGLTAKMHPEYKAQLDEMCRAWLAGRKPRKLDKKKLCGKGRKRCPSCQNIVRSNAVSCAKCDHSFAALEDAKKRQAAIKWSEDLTTKSDRSARASVAKRRQRARVNGGHAAGCAGAKKRKSEASGAGDRVPKKRGRKDNTGAASKPVDLSPSHNVASSIPTKQVRAGTDPREELIDYSLLEGYPAPQQMGAAHAASGGLQHLYGSGGRSGGYSKATSTAAVAHMLANANALGRSGSVMVGSPIEDPTYAGGARGGARGGLGPTAAHPARHATVAAYKEDSQAQAMALTSIRDPAFLTYLNTNLSSSRVSPIPTSALGANALVGAIPGVGIGMPVPGSSPSGVSSLNGSPMAAGDFMVNNLRHAALFADVLTGTSPTNANGSPNNFDSRSVARAAVFGRDDGAAQGRPMASSAVAAALVTEAVRKHRRDEAGGEKGEAGQEASQERIVPSAAWVQGVCV
jgi:hypothetical protein